MGVDCELGAFVRALRRERTVTQQDLARRSGLSARTIGDLETGVATSPRRSTLAAIAAALELDALERAHLLRFATDGNAAPARAFPQNPVPPIGREREIQMLTRAVREGSSRIHTLVGAGGIGKTTLAIEVARSLDSGADATIAFVALEEVETPDGVASRVLEALGSGPIPLVARADDTRRLVVVDNFEHVLDAAPALASLTGTFPNATFLITSRCVLGLRGETVYDVRPLPVEDARHLFTECARRAGLAGALAADEATQRVDDICRTLDGIPLAIELTVPLLRSASLEELGTRLRRRVALHAAGPRDAAKRHRSIATSLAWSFEAFDETQRAAALALAVFVGPAEIDWLAAVAGLPLDMTRAAISALSAASIAQVTYDSGGEPRARYFKMVRDYVLERAPADALSACRERHAAWLTAYGEEARARMSEAAVDDLRARAPEIQDALAWTAAARRASDGIALVNALLWPERVHSGLDPEAMRSCARRIGTLLGGFVAATEAARDAQARARNILGGMLMTLGEHDAADATMRLALDRWIATGHRKREADTVNFLAFIALGRGRYDEARDQVARMLAISGGLPEDSNVQSSALASAALASFLLGDLRAAESYWIEAERISRERFPRFAERVGACLIYVRALHGEADGDAAISELRIAAAEASDDDEFAFRIHAAAGLMAARRGDDESALAGFAAAFDRCVFSCDSGARENAHVVALHAARFFEARSEDARTTVALRAAAALVLANTASLFPVDRAYFGTLVDRLPTASDDGARAVRGLRALLQQRAGGPLVAR